MIQAKQTSEPSRCSSIGVGFGFNSSFDRSRIASCFNLSDVSERKLHEVSGAVPVVISGRTGQRGRVCKDLCPIVDKSHCCGQVSCNRMADVVETFTERFSHLKALNEYSTPNSAPKTGIHLELLLSTRSLHALQGRAEDPVGEPNLGPNLEEDQQPLSALLFGAGVRLLRGNPHRQTRGSIGSSPQSDRHTPKAICLAAKSKSGNAEKDRGNNRDSGDDYGPSIPPHDTVVDPQARASANAIPPAHSLIPLWTGAHSATPMQREEIAHG
ncbi:hypothetical protein I5U30_01065 [Stenotrophomonas maltophilia]|nr:hypothetical protein [Stenotrophomonas maltophilia]